MSISLELSLGASIVVPVEVELLKALDTSLKWEVKSQRGSGEITTCPKGQVISITGDALSPNQKARITRQLSALLARELRR